MNKNELMNNITRKFHRVSFKLQKHSPEILMGVGVVGTVASAVMACRATTKLSAILDEAKEELDVIHSVIEEPGDLAEFYTPEDGKKDLAIVYAKTGLKVFKLYAPSVALGALSLTSILASNNILHKRNVALAAAYTAVDNRLKGYRSRVVERLGEEFDKELLYNIKAKEVKETVVDEEGKKKTVKKIVHEGDPDTYSEYSRCFEAGNPGWDDDPEFTMMYLKHQQAHANDLLRLRGHLFLNEVYDMLGFHRTKAGNCVGWVYNENKPTGDNFVDFGIYRIDLERHRAFINGLEQNIMLDFNVDGPILDLI